MALKEPLTNHQMTFKQPSKSVMPNHVVLLLPQIVIILHLFHSRS